MLAFPFETIASAAVRNTMMARVIEYFSLLATIEPSADFDGNGVVDGADFLAWQRGFGAISAPPANGDANFDSVVNGADLAVWAEQFGSPATSSQPLAAPEVAASLLADEESELSAFSSVARRSPATLTAREWNGLSGRVADGEANGRESVPVNSCREEVGDERSTGGFLLQPVSEPLKWSKLALVDVIAVDDTADEAAVTAAFDQLADAFSTATD